MPDGIQIVSIVPPLANGLSADDPIALRIAYTLNDAEGTLQIWFERFQDADCTQIGYDPGGNSTLPGGMLMTLNGGATEIDISLPPIPPVDTAYIGVGVRLWNLDVSTSLAEDLRYEWCYQTRAAAAQIPTPVAVTSGNTAPPGVSVVPPAPGVSSIPSQIAGFVLDDQNANGMTDVGESFLVDLAVQLATGDCLTTLSVTRTDGNGYFEFRDMPAGNYCVILVYSSGGIVVPGTSIRVGLSETNPALTVNYCVQPPPPPPPPAAPEFGAISGTVTRDGIGQAGVAVNLFSEAVSGGAAANYTTSPTGAFSFPNLPAGIVYRIEAYDNAYGTWVAVSGITVTAGIESVEYIVFNP